MPDANAAPRQPRQPRYRVEDRVPRQPPHILLDVTDRLLDRMGSRHWSRSQTMRLVILLGVRILGAGVALRLSTLAERRNGGGWLSSLAGCDHR
jgi:hypothetical protein